MAGITPIGVNGKAGKIIEEASRTGEPVFVFRAKDLLSIMVIQHYLGLLERYVPHNHELAESAFQQLEAMREWMQEHPHEVRLPD